MNYRTRKRSWTDDALTQTVMNNFSMANVLRALNLKVTGSNYRTIRRHILRLCLSTSHWTGQGHLRGKTCPWSKARSLPLAEIMVVNSTYTSTVGLKQKLVKTGILEYECSICHLVEWCGKPLSLQLDHINGIHNDHRLENLRILCPNCHSQTPTFAGKNRKNQEGIVRLEGFAPPIAALTASAFDAEMSTIPPQPRKPKQKPCPHCGDLINIKSKKCSKCKPTKIQWPSAEELERLVWTVPVSNLSKQLGVSDKAVEKRCKKLHIEKPPRGYLAKQYAAQFASQN